VEAAVLNGERVCLEPLRVEHAEELAPVLDDPLLARVEARESPQRVVRQRDIDPRSWGELHRRASRGAGHTNATQLRMEVELRSRGRASDLLNWLDLGVDLLITLNIHHELKNLVYRTRDNNSPLHLDHGDRVCARSRRRMIVRRFGDRFRIVYRWPQPRHRGDPATGLAGAICRG